MYMVFTENGTDIKKPAWETGRALFSKLKLLFLPCLVSAAFTRPATSSGPSHRHHIGFRISYGSADAVNRLQSFPCSDFGSIGRGIADDCFDTTCQAEAIFTGSGTG
ncbi:hypothetical protein C7A11_30680 [Pseudomonas simiae]|nr:hypothetical protein C7A11_30680 [Pseudomonas simiae]